MASLRQKPSGAWKRVTGTPLGGPTLGRSEQRVRLVGGLPSGRLTSDEASGSIPASPG